MGVCDAMRKAGPRRKPTVMSSPHRPKVAGFNPVLPPPQQTPGSPGTNESAVDADAPPDAAAPGGPISGATDSTAEQLAAAWDRLTAHAADLTTLQELNERLARASALDDALEETLRAGAALVGAQRGVLALEQPDGGPEHTVGLGLARADIGQLETVPRSSSSYGRLLDALPDAHAGHGSGGGPASRPLQQPRPEIVHPDIATDDTLDPRHREVAARLGYAASYAIPLAGESAPRIGAAVWLYDEPAEPTARQRHLLALYLRCATEHISRQIELARTRADMAALHDELLPQRLPHVPGVTLARRHLTGSREGGDWYDALALPEDALGLAVGAVTGSGPGAVAAMGQLRASLRAYAVMEGEDPVAVLSDLELLLRLTEPARSATALFAYVEPAVRRVLLAGAGHCPPLIVGPHRTEYVETTLSAPLGMLACWEAPSVELTLHAGETLLLYTDGLLHRAGGDMDRAFARLHATAAGAPPHVRDDPESLADHLLQHVLPEGADGGSAGGEAQAGLEGQGGQEKQSNLSTQGHQGAQEDVVLLAARF